MDAGETERDTVWQVDVMNESTKPKQAGSWLRWVAGLLVLIGAGAAAWGALSPHNAQRLVAIEVVDQNSLPQGKLGVYNRIPLGVSNLTNRPIRIVGNNAC